MASPIGGISNFGPPEETRLTRARKKMERVDVDHHLKMLAGRVLTVLDAALSEGRQKEALKGLVKKEFREEFGRVRDFFSLPGEGEMVSEASLFGEEHARRLL